MSPAAAAGAPVLSLGEALVEFMPEPAGQSMRRAVNWRKYAGGGPATYAAAIVRCGRPAALVTRLGDDPFSDFLVDALVEEGVDVSRIRRVPGRQAGLCFHECLDGRTNLLFHRRDSAATTLGPEDIDPAAIAGAAALHVPGTTLQISAGALEAALAAMAAARAAGVPVSFDPNLRAIPGASDTAAAFEEAVAAADVVTPTLEEAAAITGLDDPVEAGRELLARGPRLVVVTLAAEGCVVLAEGEEPVSCPGYPVPVVEPTGAGDCHAAATTVGFLEGLGLRAPRRLRQRRRGHRRDRHGPLRTGPADAGAHGRADGHESGGNGMTELRIALAQTRQTADRRDNRRAILEAFDQAEARDVRILCFPEAQTLGYRVDIAEPSGPVTRGLARGVARRGGRSLRPVRHGLHPRHRGEVGERQALQLGPGHRRRRPHSGGPPQDHAHAAGRGRLRARDRPAHLLPLRRDRGRGHLLRGAALRRDHGRVRAPRRPGGLPPAEQHHPPPTTGRSPCTTP